MKKDQTPEERISKPGGSHFRTTQKERLKIELEREKVKREYLISGSKILIRLLKGVVEKDSDSGFI